MSILRQIAQLGQPVLREPGRQIADPRDPAVQLIIDDMIATVADANGVGIAAPQIYESLALFIIASRPNPRYPEAPEMVPVAMLNPELVRASNETETGWEGCLSIPGIRALVRRNRRIRVRYLNRAGDLREEEYEGFLARIFQHEYDHINGLVFLDRVDSRDIVTEKEYLRIVS
ncbi:MAG: peptide deformylase [Geobacteraceae bacterium GWC2_58_44]|nr:MAG: peptide deformylase [Geobacteraceae bacterium GWC2_58_44]HBG04177.1 peptide deformylase [Geobacter sp.]